MNSGEEQLKADTLRALHGARSLPPAEAAEALRPFLEAMNNQYNDDKLAVASITAVRTLARSLKDHHTATDDLWQEAIESTLSFMNKSA